MPVSAFLSDTFGASGRNIIRHLIEHGSIDREALDKCLKTKTRNRIDEILVALNGSLSEHQRRFLNMVFRHLEDLEAHKHTVEDEITEEVLKHTDALNLLCSIPGIDVTAAAAIIAEIGTDMSSFPDSQHICSWAGLSPGNNESAGKRKSVHINKGNPYLKRQSLSEEHAVRGRVDHGISPQAVSFRLVLESETAEGSEAGNDCVGSEDPFHHLHHAENRNSL